MNDTEAAVAALTTVGNALTRAADHQTYIIDSKPDGWPVRGASSGRSSDSTSTTERAALTLCDDQHDHERDVSSARVAIEDMRDWWAGLRTYLADGSRLAAIHRPKSDKTDGQLCDGRPFEGSDKAWVPHSRAHDNGWHDPLCVDVADESGLCVRCKVRERRWRAEHGLRPRNRNRVEDAA